MAATDRLRANDLADETVQIACGLCGGRRSGTDCARLRAKISGGVLGRCESDGGFDEVKFGLNLGDALELHV